VAPQSEVIRPLAVPLISVIVPLFNREGLICETLDSIDAQTISGRIETIVIDDGSTDAGAEVVAARKSAPGGLILVRTPNRGAAAARNVGLARCRTPYVCFLDSDDLISPDKIARQLQMLTALPEIDYVSCDWLVFESKPENPLQTYGNGGRLSWPLLPDFLQGRFFPNGNALYRYQICGKAGQWPERLRTFEDWAWHVMMGVAGARGGHIAQSMLLVRQHDAPRLSQIQSRRKLVREYGRYAQFVIRQLRRNTKAWPVYGGLVCRALFRSGVWTMRVGDARRGLSLMRRAVSLQPSPWHRLSYLAMLKSIRMVGPARAVLIYDRLKPGKLLGHPAV
jgi:glycosyltransferase involved in cell wall biosynthesis